VDLQLKGRRALVTGSSGGIGAGIARMLAEEGASVVVHGRNRERAERIAAEIGAAGVALGDLSTDEGARAAYEQARAALGGGIEILVNNAGADNGTDSTTRPFQDITVAEWLASYQGNTMATVRMILHALPDMVAAKWGRVIQISSAVAVQPNDLGLDYTAAKAGINNLSVGLAGTLKDAGVTFNTVSPGVIASENMIVWARNLYASQGSTDLSDEAVGRRLATEFARIPVGFLGSAEHVGLIVCTLASPRADYITGANYRVDGGQVRSIN
jgi:NAD(P)-dependent dehydrogenase (short-subunit alcohol dehydrogenase family)